MDEQMFASAGVVLGKDRLKQILLQHEPDPY
jgi:hypothetical protein